MHYNMAANDQRSTWLKQPTHSNQVKFVARCLQKIANGKAYKEPEEVIKKYFSLSTSIKQENFIMVLGSLVPRNRENAKFIQAKVLPT